MPAVSSSLTRQKSHSEDTQRYLRAVGSSANAGGTVRIDATQGDANIIGSQVFGHEGLQLTASRDVNILAAGEPLDKHYRGSSRLSGIMPGDSAFSRFIGNKTDRSRQEGSEIIQSGSVVGSGSGDTLIQAGRSYTQTGSRLLADGNIDIRAQNITVQAADSPYRSDYYHSYTQKGLTVAVGTLVTDLMQTAQAAAASAEQVGQSRHDRVNIMAAANSAYQGYQAYQMAANSVRNATAPKAAGNTGSGSNGKSGSKGGPINISITYGEQHNSEHNHVDGNQTTASGIQAQGQVRLTAAGAGEQSDIRITGSDVAGERGTYLAAEHNLLLEAAREQRNETRRSRQAGWNAGVALSVGNGLSLGVTGGGNYGRGKGDGESTTYRHSHIGSSRSRTELVSGADTTLHGARVEGKGIGLTARNLNITTPQDSERYRGKQFHGNVQITVGYGFSGNAEYSQSKTDADHLSASEQSGLYAGDDGFQVAVSRHTELNGGLIVSSQSAEQNGRNRFQTGSLGQSDLANHSRYSGKSFGFGMSGGINGKGKQEIGESGNVRWAAQGQSDANGIAQGSSGRFSQGFGFGKEQDSQSSTTRSGIGTRNIQITDAAEQQRRSAQSVQQAAEGIYTDRRTETADATAGYLKNGFDRERMEKELDVQREVRRTFRATAFAEIDQLISPRQQRLREQLKAAQTEDERTPIYDELYKLQYARQTLETLVGVLSADPQISIGQGILRTANLKMRRLSLDNSRKSPIIVDPNHREGEIDHLSNVSYESGAFDGVKLGGTRTVLDIICGKGSGGNRCTDNLNGTIQYKGDDAFPTLADVINPKINPAASSLYGGTGGLQGVQGELFGMKYHSGSFVDRVIESFAGAHDLMGGQIWGFYSDNGNTSRNRSMSENVGSQITTTIAIPVSAPFALSDLLDFSSTKILFDLWK